MTDRDPDLLTPEQERARAAVRALARPAAAAAFRARLEAEFVSGRLAAGRLRMLAGAARRRRWAFAAAAAAVVIVVALLGGRGAPWRVTAVAGAGVAVVDGRPVPLGHLAELARRIRPGAMVEVPGGAEIEIASGASIVLSLAPGTELKVPGAPARWAPGGGAAELRRGTLRITTGARFRGARLAVATPEAEVEVRGTTLAVICEPQGTCVCVLEGGVRVGPRGGPMVTVPEGRRRFLYRDGRAPADDVIRPAEGRGLAEFRDRGPARP